MSFLQLNDIESVTLHTRLFGLADSVRAVSVWGHFGQTMKSCRNLTCSHFDANILKSTRSFI